MLVALMEMGAGLGFWLVQGEVFFIVYLLGF
jgi:hypothetical protein